MVDSPDVAGLVPLASGLLSFNSCRAGARLAAGNLAMVTTATEHGAFATPGTQKHATDRFHHEPLLHRKIVRFGSSQQVRSLARQNRVLAIT
jgi:hypothetical protein